MTTDTQIVEFVARWKPSGGSEYANYQLFVIEMTELLCIEHLFPANDDDANDHYRFERRVTFAHSLAALGQAEKGDDGRYAA